MKIFCWLMTGFNAASSMFLMGAGLTSRAWFCFVIAGVNGLCATYFEWEASND